MKKITMLLIFVMVLGVRSIPLMANDQGFQTYWLNEDVKKPYEHTLSRKFTRGLNNFAFGWTEVIMQPRELIKQDERLMPALFEGVLRGFVFGAGRFAAGCVDMATFFIDTPPVFEPELPFPTRIKNKLDFPT